MTAGGSFEAAEILAQFINTPATVAYEAGEQDRKFATLPDALDYIRDHPAVDMKNSITIQAAGENVVIEGNQLLALVDILPERRV
jgi:hypothetical protein